MFYFRFFESFFFWSEGKFYEYHQDSRYRSLSKSLLSQFGEDKSDSNLRFKNAFLIQLYTCLKGFDLWV